jgi:tRNA dimethylallyltransferase
MIVIAGPTACGKSGLALSLAERIGGEILSVDSMQVYRGMDIGTAKPSPEERVRIPHHLVDVAEITEHFDAAQFARLAHQAVAEIQNRHRVPILCGGTGLYFRAFFEGVGSAPPADPLLRKKLEETPLPVLLKELAERDPAAYQRIDRNNPRRIIRAVEVIRVSGKPFSEQKADWSSASPGVPAFGLRRNTKDLHERINRRVDAMFAQGLVEETRQLLERGLSENAIAMQALGYRQVAEHLRGERSLEETIELVKLRTRQFAKRQMTWFRHQMSLQWIDAARDQPSHELADQIFKTLK